VSYGLKMLLIAAGAAATCIVVLAGIDLASKGREDVRNANEEYESLIPDVQVIYDLDERIVTGKEVIDYMKLYSEADVYFQVKTCQSFGSEGTFYHRTQDLKEEAGEYRGQEMNQMDGEYINPAGLFECSLVKNENGILIGIQFIQRGD